MALTLNIGRCADCHRYVKEGQTYCLPCADKRYVAANPELRECGV
jgi:hypothetical protein